MDSLAKNWQNFHTVRVPSGQLFAAPYGPPAHRFFSSPEQRKADVASSDTGSWPRQRGMHRSPMDLIYDNSDLTAHALMRHAAEESEVPVLEGRVHEIF